MKRLFTLFLAMLLIVSTPAMETLAAPEWPADIKLQAEGGIVIDADSGAVLYGENIHVPYFPASITKIMTALIVLENSKMDEIVTFSQNAVYNVEAGSSNAGLDVGDQLTVEETLYAMMFRSANEAANALAEHVSGTLPEFAKLMNDKAKELGCENTNFVNPSGLNDPEHKTTAYDMALIAKAAFANEAFVKIDSSTSYKLPPTIRNTEGLLLTPGHKMLYKNGANYYPGIVGGKTGYTSLAGNTLVTCAQRDGMKLIAVILNGHKTHYEDTKLLLDFGFEKFQSLKIIDYEKRYQTFENDMVIAGVGMDTEPAFAWGAEDVITIPKTAEFSDAAGTFTYEMGDSDPEGAIAKIEYVYGDRKVGTTYLQPGLKTLAAVRVPADQLDILRSAQTPQTSPPPEESSAEDTTENTDGTDKNPSSVASDSSALKPGETDPGKSSLSLLWIVLAVVAAIMLLAGIGFAYKVYSNRKEEEERMRRRRRRMERLQESGYSESDFDKMLEQKRGPQRTGTKKKR